MRRRMSFMAAYFLMLAVSLTACSAVPQQNPLGEIETESEEGSETSSGQNPPEEDESHPYLSITYGRDNPDNFTGRDMVFYTYDIVTGELEEQCVIPFDSQYACGLVSKADNKVYYSSRSEPNTLGVCDGLWAYDLVTGKSSLLETNNWSYNSITMIRPGKLLVMAVTKEHPILPALFDLETNSFTYMPEANDEPFDLYTFGPTEAVYNSGTHEITCIFQNEDEIYTTEFGSNETPVDTYIAVASEDMVKDPKRTFAVSLKMEDQVLSATQISENELLVVIFHMDMDPFAAGSGLDTEYRLYSLVFEDGKGTLTPVDSPYPNSAKWNTIDGGKNFYFLRQSEEEPQRGLYSYCTETGELTPILLGDLETNGHVVSYTILNP